MSGKNIKKDALWKPLLRQFRRFIKFQAANNRSAENHRQSLNSHSEIETKAFYYAQTFSLPAHLQPRHAQDYGNAYGLFILIESNRISHQRRIIPYWKELMKPYVSNTVERIYFKIFYENCKKQRIDFFKDRLIQHLWN
jgi:hypothetical protein